MFEIQIGRSIVLIDSANELQAYVDSGKVTRETPIRKVGGAKWSSLQNVRGLRFPESIVQQTTAAPPPLTDDRSASRKRPPVPLEEKQNAPAQSPVQPKAAVPKWILPIAICSVAVVALLSFVTLRIATAKTPKQVFEESVLLDVNDVPREIFVEGTTRTRRSTEITQVFWTPVAWDIREDSSQRFPLVATVEHFTSAYVYEIKKSDADLEKAISLITTKTPVRVNVASKFDVITEKYRNIFLSDFGLEWNQDSVNVPLVEVFRRMSDDFDPKTKSWEVREKSRLSVKENKRNLTWIPCIVDGVDVMVHRRSFYSKTEWLWDVEKKEWQQQPGEASLYPYSNQLVSHKTYVKDRELPLTTP